jgi:uncharacterized protein (TIGR02284 family)
MDLLGELVRASRDVEAAFIVCADEVDSEALRFGLLAQAQVCGRAATELSSLASARGSKVRDDGAMGTDAAPDWVALRNALVDGDSADVLDECIRAEERLLMRFRDVFEHQLSADIGNAVAFHFGTLIQNRGRLRELRLPALLRQGHAPRDHRPPNTRSAKLTPSL